MKLLASKIKPNPNNPRVIKDAEFQRLVQSLKDMPEMAEVRQVVLNTDHMILGGNMRFKAMVEAGWAEIPVVIVDWPEAKQREFIVKDNVSGGEWDWDILKTEWDTTLLADWGLPLPAYMTEEYQDEFSLNDDDKSNFGAMNFMLAEEQQELIKRALSAAGKLDGETFGNENGNGNKLYWIVEQWLNS